MPQRIRRPRIPRIPPIIIDDHGHFFSPGGIDIERILNGTRNPGEAINHAKEELKKLDLNMSDEDFNIAVDKATPHAKAYYEEHKENGSFCDCVEVTAAACAAGGAYVGGIPGAALGAAGGYPMGKLVCENWYERTPCD